MKAMLHGNGGQCWCIIALVMEVILVILVMLIMEKETAHAQRRSAYNI